MLAAEHMLHNPASPKQTADVDYSPSSMHVKPGDTYHLPLHGHLCSTTALNILLVSWSTILLLREAKPYRNVVENIPLFSASR